MKSPSEATARRTAVAVLAAGLIWRALLCFAIVPAWERRAGVAPTPDMYPALAESLVERGTFGYGDLGASPTTVRGPGFPLWLAGGLLLGGRGSAWLGFWGGLPGLAVAAWIAYALGRRRGIAAALVGGAVAALHPLPAFTSARVMGDDFYGALGFAAAAVWCWALQPRVVPAGRTVLAGLLLALHVLARASGFLTLLVLLAVGLARRRFRACLLLAVAALVAPVGWSIRTSALEGRPVFVHSLGAYNFWIGEGLDRFGPGPPPAGHWGKVLDLVLAEAGREPGESPGFWYVRLQPAEAAELDAALRKAALRRVLGQPGSYLGRFSRGLGRFWFQAQTAPRSLQYLAAALPVLLLAGIGAWAGRPRGGRPEGLWPLLVGIVVLHNVVYAAVLPMARLSVQVYPAVAYLAGLGAAEVLARTGSGRPATGEPDPRDRARPDPAGAER